MPMTSCYTLEVCHLIINYKKASGYSINLVKSEILPITKFSWDPGAGNPLFSLNSRKTSQPPWKNITSD